MVTYEVFVDNLKKYNVSLCQIGLLNVVPPCYKKIFFVNFELTLSEVALT